MSVTSGTLLDGRVRYDQLAAGHRSGFEPVLLAAAVPAKSGQKVLEAGCGAGAGLLCLSHRVPGIFGTGIEIVPALAELATENFRANGLGGFTCVVADAAAPGFGAVFDHVMANPPWHDAAGTRSPDGGRALAHHAPAGLLAGWITGLASCLQPRLQPRLNAHATITLILPAAALSEAVAALRANRFGKIVIFPLWPRAGLAAKQIIVAACLGARAADSVLPGLVLHDAGGITAQAEGILRDGGALPVWA